MRSHALLRAGLLLAGLLPFMSVGASASTNVVYARHHGQWMPVVRVDGSAPFVLDGNKVVPADMGEYAMRPITRYVKGMPAPVILRVDNLKVGTQWLQFVGDSQVLNNQFDISMVIKAPINLANVYAVFVLSGDRGQKSVLVRGIGDLKAGDPDFFEYHVPIESQMGPFRYQVHFFSNAIELFFAQEGWSYINAEVFQHILAETDGIQKANPRPYVLTPPVVPESVRKAGRRVIVKVRATILANGSVPDASAVAGTPADQAEAAETAVKMSYFLPRIADGLPEQCKVVIPVVLDPKSPN